MSPVPIYCEKPTADNLEDALDLARLAKQAGVRNGAVQDKLFLPGFRKLKMAIDSGFLGKLLSVRGEFGYWVFEGDLQPAQRRPGTTRKPSAAALSSTCSATGATCSTTSSAKRSPCPASAPRTSRCATTSRATPTKPTPTTRH